MSPRAGMSTVHCTASARGPNVPGARVAWSWRRGGSPGTSVDRPFDPSCGRGLAVAGGDSLVARRQGACEVAAGSRLEPWWLSHWERGLEA